MPYLRTFKHGRRNKEPPCRTLSAHSDGAALLAGIGEANLHPVAPTLHAQPVSARLQVQTQAKTRPSRGAQLAACASNWLADSSRWRQLWATLYPMG
jgi:hypothetical protein